MAVNAGVAKVVVDVELTGEARRVVALERAIGWARSHRNGAPSGDSVVAVAKKFEAYLEGGGGSGRS
ncbi:hypothetical protein SEA_PERMAG_58 [Microbacterium phage PermaG]|uniref:Uncharacterized protein n=2 Tax=Goodmanvirus goodman TaxID=2734238 RepID=A0A3G3M028_9CAUD|nr:hypothetical protein HOU56_gp58 [Microbacterium phage Goodman]AYQ99513.1 hypothetical protein PBI_GOODMAN_58 [Microbacterium phage Goodman]AYQ99681.1 hypothetical protein PBI_JOHANN_58 [Microbacterium phage Johann]QWY83846.1 hypothetical protein SEA_PERMAG_58 [Microbacterium phage PermaG]